MKLSTVTVGSRASSWCQALKLLHMECSTCIVLAALMGIDMQCSACFDSAHQQLLLTFSDQSKMRCRALQAQDNQSLLSCVSRPYSLCSSMQGSWDFTAECVPKSFRAYLQLLSSWRSRKSSLRACGKLFRRLCSSSRLSNSQQLTLRECCVVLVY